MGWLARSDLLPTSNAAFRSSRFADTFSLLGVRQNRADELSGNINPIATERLGNRSWLMTGMSLFVVANRLGLICFWRCWRRTCLPSLCHSAIFSGQMGFDTRTFTCAARHPHPTNQALSVRLDRSTIPTSIGLRESLRIQLSKRDSCR